MKSTKCPACGFVGWSDLDYCKACGASFAQRSAYAAQASSEGWNETEGQKKGLAIIALVIGIISLFTLGMLGVGAIIGIILAVVAMKRVSNAPRQYGGKGMAIAGLVLSITSLVTAVPVGLIAAIAIPNFLMARMAANEGSAIYSLRTISAAEMTYQSQYQRYGTLEELGAARLIDPKLASGTKNGYRFTLELTNVNAAAETFDESSAGFAVSCVPLTYRSSGTRSFYVDETHILRGADNVGQPSSNSDPPLQTGPVRPDLGEF